MTRFCRPLLHCAIALMGTMLGCGAKSPDPAAVPESNSLDSERGVEIVRKSFEAIGGLERLRLIGGKASIAIEASVRGKTLPVQIAFSGQGFWRLDDVDSQISYIYAKDNCHKVIYGIVSQCAAEERAWMDPVRVWVELVLPPADVANFAANFRHRGEEQCGSDVCDIVEVQPLNSKLRLRAYYAKQSHLPVNMEFSYDDDPLPIKTRWSVQLGDWREVKGVKLPFRRVLRKHDDIVATEQVLSYKLECEESVFLPPAPPATDHTLTANLPEREVIYSKIDSYSVEIPAPPTLFGGAPDVKATRKMRPAMEVEYILIQGTLEEAQAFKKLLIKDVESKNRKWSGTAQVIPLETFDSTLEPSLIMIYLALTE